MARILIVDDEPHIRILLAQTLKELEDQEADLPNAENGEEALAIIREERPEPVVSAVTGIL